MESLKLFAAILLISVSLHAETAKEKALKAQAAALQAQLAAQAATIQNMQNRVSTLQSTADATSSTTQVLIKENQSLAQHNSTLVAALPAVIAQVQSNKAAVEAVVDTKVDTVKILQGVDSAKAVAAKAAVVLRAESKRHDEQHVLETEAVNDLINLSTQMQRRAEGEHLINKSIKKDVTEIEGMMSGLQRIMLVAIFIISILILNVFLLLRGQLKRRHVGPDVRRDVS